MWPLLRELFLARDMATHAALMHRGISGDCKKKPLELLPAACQTLPPSFFLTVLGGVRSALAPTGSRGGRVSCRVADKPQNVRRQVRLGHLPLSVSPDS